MLIGDKVAMNPLRASSKLWVSSKFSFSLNDCWRAFVDFVAAFGARMDSGSGEYLVTGRFAISSLGGLGYRVPTATQVRKMSDKPKTRDSLQYVIGALISIVLLSSYLVLSNKQEEKLSVVETSLRDVSLENKDQGQAKKTDAQHWMRLEG